MAPATNIDDNLKFVMLVLKHSDAFKPNYHAVAEEGGINSANVAQKKFKKCVEQAGFALVGGAVTDPDGGGGANTPKIPTTKKTTTTPTSKKRKADVVEDDAEVQVKRVAI